MIRLVNEVNQLSSYYVRKGGKDNRKQQRGRMISFARYAAELGAHSMGQVGDRHVVAYWKAKRDLSPATLYSHWLAICTLWELTGKLGIPPRPRGID